MHVVCEGRFIPLGCQVPQSFLPDDLAEGPQAVACFRRRPARCFS